MTAQIKDKIQELSLMLVMTSESDETSMQMLREVASELLTQLKADPVIEKAFSGKLSQLLASSDVPSVTLERLRKFIDEANTFLDNPEVAQQSTVSTLQEAKEEVKSEEAVDENSKIDTTFLAEYLETHTLLLEEFEANLVEFKLSGGDANELTTAVKRYIHNLKGDSGALGVISVERACHEVEDYLTDHSAGNLTKELIQFKEWIVDSFRALAEGRRANPSEDFLKKFRKSLSEGVQESLPHEVVVVIPPPKPLQEHQEKGAYQLSGEMEVLVEFIVEAEEHLSSIEGIILESEGEYSKDLVDNIFRCVHSVKGGSAYFTIKEMTDCSHVLENILSDVRDGKREIDAQLGSLLLEYIDILKNIFSRTKEAINHGGKMCWSAESSSFLERVSEYQVSGKITTSQVVKKKDEANRDKELELVTNPTKQRVNEQQDRGEDEDSQRKGDKLNLKTFVKVETSRLDQLVDSIGEMVIYSSMLIRQCRELLAGHESVMTATQRVEKFARDLQDIGMSMRLVPIKGLFQKMSRLVWDVSKKLDKDINFVMEGEDTELDRNLIDKLADPLMHMVRNSIDHGIESKNERIEKGKANKGKISLSAFHSGGSIHIKVQDDGRGLDPEKIFNKAVEKGIVTPTQKLSESEIFNLVFAPGFSTAAAVTDISGRGVGMDVVKKNVESLRGRIHISSKLGEGSAFTIEIPLTLAIIDGIEIRVGAEHFIIPSLSIVEFVRPKDSMFSVTLDKAETLCFRGKFLPIYRISELYNIPSNCENPLDATLVVVENNGEHVALMVDDILGEYSTVIKNLGLVFEEGKGFAGCAILPNGDVALILDIRSLVEVARSEYQFFSHTSSVPSLSLT